MNTKIIAMCALFSVTAGCGTQVGGEGCFSDGQTALEDTSITPEGWDQTAVTALQALSLATYAEGNATIDDQSVPITVNLELDGGEELYTFPGEATLENGCEDWVVKSGTLKLDGAIEGAVPVVVTLSPDAKIYEDLSVEEAATALPNLTPPDGAETLLVTLKLTDDTWTGSVQWLLEGNQEGDFIEFEASSVQ